MKVLVLTTGDMQTIFSPYAYSENACGKPGSNVHSHSRMKLRTQSETKLFKKLSMIILKRNPIEYGLKRLLCLKNNRGNNEVNQSCFFFDTSVAWCAQSRPGLIFILELNRSNLSQGHLLTQQRVI